MYCNVPPRFIWCFQRMKVLGTICMTQKNVSFFVYSILFRNVKDSLYVDSGVRSTEFRIQIQTLIIVY